MAIAYGIMIMTHKRLIIIIKKNYFKSYNYNMSPDLN